jgi:hypothetical protein
MPGRFGTRREACRQNQRPGLPDKPSSLISKIQSGESNGALALSAINGGTDSGTLLLDRPAQLSQSKSIGDSGHVRYLSLTAPA